MYNYEKINLFIGLSIIIIIGMTFCSKQELSNSMQIKKEESISLRSKMVFNPDFLVNKNNPYDEYGLKMVEFYTDLAPIFVDSTYSDYELFEKAFNSLFEKHSSQLYPELSIDDFDEYENEIIRNFSESINYKNLKEVSLKYENEILSDKNLSNIQQSRLLSIVSTCKFVEYYQSEILIYAASTWEERVDNCMNRELGEIFADDGNPVLEIVFIATIPESLLCLEAECAWEATFRTHPDNQ